MYYKDYLIDRLLHIAGLFNKAAQDFLISR